MQLDGKNWISKLLSKRLIYPALGNSNIIRTVGRVPSPLLKNLVMNEQIWGSDEVLTISSRFVDTIRDRMQLALKRVSV